MDITKKQKLVLDAIKKNPRAADDDAELFATVWIKEGWDCRLSLVENLKRVTRPETLTRRRRELHEAGLVKYSDDADNTRFEAYKNERFNNDHSAVSWMDKGEKL